MRKALLLVLGGILFGWFVVILAAPIQFRALADNLQQPIFSFPYPILDTTPHLHVIGGHRYAIPSNFYGPKPTKDGATSGLSIRVFAPDMIGLTRENAACLDNRNPCSDQSIIVGIMAGEGPAQSRVLERIQEQSFPDSKAGPCNLEYYESRGHPSHRLIYFFRRMSTNLDWSILRCSQRDGELGGLCNSTENIGDGNQFYFVMSSRKLCDWPDIRTKIMDRIASFRSNADRSNSVNSNDGLKSD